MLQWNLQLAIDLLKKRVENRSPQEISILLKATQKLMFFQQINLKPVNVEMQLHEKCCRKFKHESFTKGQVIFFSGTRPQKFYLIMSGSVVVYIPKSYSRIQEEKYFGQSTYNELFEHFKHLENLIFPSSGQSPKTNQQNLKNVNSYDLKNAGKNVFQVEEEEDHSDNEEKLLKDAAMPGEQLLEGELAEAAPEIDNDIDELEKKVKKCLGGLKPNEYENPQHFFSGGVFIYDCVSVLGPGNIFGELGLLTKKPRAATIVAKEDCNFAVLDADDYKEILSIVEKKKLDQKANFFNSNIFHDFFNNSILHQIAYFFLKKKFNYKQKIFQEGDESMELYFIQKGKVKVSKTIKRNNSNKIMSIEKKMSYLQIENEEKMEVAILEVGQGFGEEDLINEVPRTYAAEVLSQSLIVFYITKEKFNTLVSERPEVLDFFKNRIIKKNLWRGALESTFKEARKDMQAFNKIRLQEIMVRQVDPNKVTNLKEIYFKNNPRGEVKQLIKTLNETQSIFETKFASDKNSIDYASYLFPNLKKKYISKFALNSTLKKNSSSFLQTIPNYMPSLYKQTKSITVEAGSGIQSSTFKNQKDDSPSIKDGSSLLQTKKFYKLYERNGSLPFLAKFEIQSNSAGYKNSELLLIKFTLIINK